MFTPNIRLLKLLRHTYLQHAPVLSTLALHFNQAPSQHKASTFSQGPFTCAHHSATTCLQNNHQRKAHLRQLARSRYQEITLSIHGDDPTSNKIHDYTPPGRFVGPHPILHSSQPSPPRRLSLTATEIHSFLRSIVVTNTWTPSPTIPCAIFSTADNSHLCNLQIPNNILLWQFEESFNHHHITALRTLNTTTA